MKLYLFPAPADINGGYNIAVKDAYDRINPSESDDILWCCLFKPDCAKEHHFIHYYTPFYSLHTIKKVCTGRLNTELSLEDLKFTFGKDYEEIHCDDVIFYKAIRKIFPDKKISVRFHNCFARIADRSRLLNIKSDWRFEGKLRLSTRLEREIFVDPLVHKIFITSEDANYYHLMTGKNDYSIWTLIPDKEKIIQNRNFKRNIVNKVVWYGGVEGHKISSINWFINQIFPEIKKRIPSLEFHLFGRNTEKFNNASIGIFSHGEYKGDDMPLKQEALYINPDILGGGIKVKIQTYFNNGVTFISSPFGFEGYDTDLIDNDFCYVVEESKWVEQIIKIFEGFRNENLISQ